MRHFVRSFLLLSVIAVPLSAQVVAPQSSTQRAVVVTGASRIDADQRVERCEQTLCIAEPKVDERPTQMVSKKHIALEGTTRKPLRISAD